MTGNSPPGLQRTDDVNVGAEEEEEEEGEDGEDGEQEYAGEEEEDDTAGANAEPEGGDQESNAQADAGPSKPKRKPKAPGSNQLNRQYGGKALLPVSRVQKIIKADKVRF